MRSLFVLVAVLFAFVNADIEEEENVLVLTKDNFEEATKKHEYLLVEFYAPWCGHCKALAPEYAKAATKLKEDGSHIKLGKVDATVHSELASKHEVQGYPTLKFFKSGSASEYGGGRTSDSIVSWLVKKTGPPVTVVKTEEEIEKHKTEHRLVAAFFTEDPSCDAFKVVSDVAFGSDSIPFIHVSEKSLFSKYGASEKSFMLFKQFDENKVAFSGELTKVNLENFIKSERVALVTEFSQETAQIVFESEIKVHILAFSAKNNADTYDAHTKILEEVARKFKGKLHVVVLNMDDSESPRIAEFFSVTTKDVPTFRILNLTSQMVKYQPPKTDFTAEYISEFTQGVLDGKIKPHLKSQEEPSDWDSKPVKVLVAKTFNDHAKIADKIVFVEFYAPWCGHCKALAPIWDELGEAYKDNKDIVIGKMDSTENELEDIEIGSFPTLKFSPQGSTEFVNYSGERTLDAFKQFIDSNGKETGAKPTEGKEKHDEL